MTSISRISKRGKDIVMWESQLVSIVKTLEPGVSEFEIEKKVFEIKYSFLRRSRSTAFQTVLIGIPYIT
jgi:hypothetical protein